MHLENKPDSKKSKLNLKENLVLVQANEIATPTTVQVSIFDFLVIKVKYVQNSVNLQFNTVGRWDDDMMVSPSDGPMIIWIDWE